MTEPAKHELQWYEEEVAKCLPSYFPEKPVCYCVSGPGEENDRIKLEFKAFSTLPDMEETVGRLQQQRGCRVANFPPGDRRVGASQPKRSGLLTYRKGSFNCFFWCGVGMFTAIGCSTEVPLHIL